MKKIWERAGFLAGGIIIGTAGLKALTSRDAKKVYTHATALTLRAKDSVMGTVSKVRENCGDILSEAQDINENLESDEKREIVESE
ncbi:MAG: DUF6110 family protein [Hornefia sp.]|nr:DUF6110 family protein [Hornefia sp.]